MFKAKFQSLANVRGINHLDVLNKLPNWLRGAPKRLTEASGLNWMDFTTIGQRRQKKGSSL